MTVGIIMGSLLFGVFSFFVGFIVREVQGGGYTAALTSYSEAVFRIYITTGLFSLGGLIYLGVTR